MQREPDVKEDNLIQGDNSDVLSVLGEHLPIQLVTRYADKRCFIRYHVFESSVKTLRCVCAYHQHAWHFDASSEGHEMANVKAVSVRGTRRIIAPAILSVTK